MRKILIMSAGAFALSTAAYAQDDRDATSAQTGAQTQQTQQGQTDQHTQTQSGQWNESGQTRTQQTGQSDWEEAGEKVERTADKAKHAMKKAGAKLSEAAEDAGQAVDENMRRLASDASAPYDQEEAQAIRAVVDATSKPVVRIGDHAVLTRNAHSIEKLMGREVFNATGDRIASVDDVILDQDGRAQSLIVSAGGFMGLNAREYEISFDRVRMQPNEDGEPRLTIGATANELRAQPRYERSGAATGEIFASDLIGTEVDFQRTAALGEQTGQTTAGAVRAETAADARANAQARADGRATTTTTTTAQDAQNQQVDTAYLRDLVLDGEGRAQFAVLGYNGVLGMGETQAIVDYDRIQIAQGGEGLYFSGSAQELANATTLASSVDQALDRSARTDQRGMRDDRRTTDELNRDQPQQ